MRALEVGPGRHPARDDEDGYDWDFLEHPDEQLQLVAASPPLFCIWGEQPIPAEAETYDLFYASHVLEHVPWPNTAAALAEAFRVLKPGGEIELWVPNFEYLVECYLHGRCGDDWRHKNPEGDPMLWLNGRIFTYGPGPNWHRACFDTASLTKAVLAAGFSFCTRLDPWEEERGAKHGPISLGIRAQRKA